MDDEEKSQAATDGYAMAPVARRPKQVTVEPASGGYILTFVGLNENGWIFRCADLSQKQNRIRLLRRNGLVGTTEALAPMHPWHYFVAEPADA